MKLLLKLNGLHSDNCTCTPTEKARKLIRDFNVEVDKDPTKCLYAEIEVEENTPYEIEMQLCEEGFYTLKSDNSHFAEVEEMLEEMWQCARAYYFSMDDIVEVTEVTE